MTKEIWDIKEKLARYPFFKKAKNAVEGKSIEDLLIDPVIERAKQRVISAAKDENIGNTSPHDIELLSYPAARALISATGNRRLISKYAWVEASVGFEKLQEDIKENKMSFKDIAEEFDVKIKKSKKGYKIKLRDYLKLSPTGEKWKLINRELTNGWISISTNEILKLAQEGIRKRVTRGLPIEISGEVRESLPIESVQGILEQEEIEVIEEESFPPCMKEILKEIQKGHPEHHSWFSLTSFLSNIGMDEEEVLDKYSENPDFDRELAEYQVKHIHGDYTCPSCSTMKTYGDCRKPDELCNTIKNPLSYYRKKVKSNEKK